MGRGARRLRVGSARSVALLADPSILPQRHFTENRRWRDMMLRATRLFNVLSASVSPEDVEERARVLRNGDVFATVISKGPSRALALDYQRFHRFLLAFPESSLALMRLTVERLIKQRGERRR